MDVVDPDAIHAAREALRAAIGAALGDELARRASQRRRGGRRSVARGQGRPAAAHASRSACSPPATRGRRAALAKAQFDGADNMTDRQGALGVLVSLDAPEREAALGAFYDRFRDDALVLDKWFALQAAAQRADTVDAGRSARRASGLHHRQPQPRCARWPACSAAITGRSTRADGRGYAFLADMILAADQLNPQVAARLVPAFGRWRRFEPKRAALMRAGARADRRGAGPVEGRVRAGAARASPERPSRRSSLATSSATWLAARLSAGADRRGGAVGGRAGDEAAGFDPAAALGRQRGVIDARSPGRVGAS